MEEVRTYGSVECRAGDLTIGGYALTFNKRSRPIGVNRFVEQVHRNFVSRSKAAGYKPILCRYSHDDKVVLGNTEVETCRVTDDHRGLAFEVDVPEYHRWVYESIKRGDCRSASFTMANVADEWSYAESMPVRTLLDGDILEVGPCPIGAYPDAVTTALRSLAAAKQAPYEDVRQMYETNTLPRLFTRSDQTPTKTLSGARARKILTDMRYPKETPYQRLTNALESPVYYEGV